MPTRVTTTAWLWALLPLLLSAALVIPLLNVDAFNDDEPASLFAAGIRRPGPWSPADVWGQTALRHAPGWAMLLSVWGPFVGWSEFAIKTLSFFVGLLTLAWVYRTGRDLFAPAAGLFAALLLSASVIHLAYMTRADLYALVALCAAICLWYYWRVALHSQEPGRGKQAGLLLGSIGLLYSHYLGALLLPVLGLFHLFFVPKNRRWLRTVLLFGLALIVAALQIPLVTRGLAHTDKEDLGSRFLAAPAFLSHLLSHMTNGLVNLSPSLALLLYVGLTLALVIVILRFLRAGKRAGAVWLLVFTSVTLISLVIAINEALKIITPTRIRYIMPLWPLTALLAGAGLWRLTNKHRILATGMLVLWLILGAWLLVATDYRYELGFVFRTDFHRIFPLASKYVPATDFLIMDFAVAGRDAILVQARDLNGPWDTLYRSREDPYESIRPVHSAYPYIWLLYRTKDRVSMTDLPGELGRVLCERTLEEWGFTLERYALHSVANCPDRPIRLVFDSDIQLTAPEITISDGLLRLDAHFRSADDYLLSRYSLAVHVIDPRTGERVAQGDVGVGPGAIAPLRSDIDISALPPGDYELHIALYDWQTGERLPASDLVTDASGNMLTLHYFRLN